MKAVIMLAGFGKRMGNLTIDKPKSMIELNRKPLIWHFLKRIEEYSNDLVIIVGHFGDVLIDYIKKEFKFNLEIATNPDFMITNNMYSIWCARDYIRDKEFILCNGDVVLNKGILRNIFYFNGAGIMLDQFNKTEEIDSPKTIIQNDRIVDLGRHIDISKNGGYAMGLYKFDKGLSKLFFNEIERLVKLGQLQTGFHDPLIPIFNKYQVKPISTDGLSWTDLDHKDEINRVEKVLTIIEKEEATK